MEAVFQSSEIAFFNKSFILASGNGFSVNCKPCGSIQSSLLLMDTILEIKCRPIFKGEHYSWSLKPFSWIFADIPASESSLFRLVETEFSSNPSLRLVYTDFG